MDATGQAAGGGNLQQELQDFMTRAQSGDHAAVTAQEAAARHDQIAGLLSSSQYQEVATKVLGDLSPEARTQFAGWLQQAAGQVASTTSPAAAQATPGAAATPAAGGASVTEPAAGLAQLNQLMGIFGGLMGGAAAGTATPGTTTPGGGPSIDPANLAALTDQLRQINPASFSQLLGGGMLDNPIAKMVVAGIAAAATRHVTPRP